MQLQPLPAASLSPAVATLVGGATPAKLMAARGMAPLRPAELLVAIYQLSFDADATVRAAAETGPASFPDNVINPPLGEDLPAPLLHFFATRLPDQRAAALERILYNPATADETFVMLAGRLDESLLEVVAQNEVRLLRCPAIVEALFLNKRARMSSVNRAVELCARNGVRLEGIPAFDEIVSAIRQDPEATDGAATDGRFQAVLTAADLKSRLSSGQSFAQICSSLGFTQEKIKQILQGLRQAPHKASLDALVASGKMTQAQEDAILSHGVDHGQNRNHAGGRHHGHS